MHTCIFSTEWVYYVEEPMKYQAFLPHFGSVDGWLEGSWGGLGGWVVCWGRWVCGGVIWQGGGLLLVEVGWVILTPPHPQISFNLTYSC